MKKQSNMIPKVNNSSITEFKDITMVEMTKNSKV
jgi:hypothetical protein